MTPNTVYQYKRMIIRFAADRVAHPNETVTASVRAFLASLTPSSAHTAFLALRLALPGLDWSATPHPRARRNEAVLVDTLFGQDEIPQMRAAFAEPRVRAICETFWVLRRAETARGRWADVNLSTGTIRVTRKGGKVGMALLPASAQLALAEWYVAARQPPDDAPIFPGRFGKPMTPGALSKIVRRVLREAGLYRPWRGAHAWRRTFVTRYMEQNPGDGEGCAKLLGHESPVTTFAYNWMLPATLRPRLDRVKL